MGGVGTSLDDLGLYLGIDALALHPQFGSVPADAACLPYPETAQEWTDETIREPEPLTAAFDGQTLTWYKGALTRCILQLYPSHGQTNDRSSPA